MNIPLLVRSSTCLFASALLGLLGSGCATTRAISLDETGASIVSVADWGGTPDTAAHPIQTVRAVTIHHGGVPFTRSEDPKLYLQHLQQWSRSEKKWSDIPYHYLIDLDGTMYAGRDIRYAGDTNTEYNPDGHALICVLGNFEEVEPNAKQLDAIVRLSAWLCRQYHLSPETIKSHRDYSSQTVCPGKNLYVYLQNGYIRNGVTKLLEGDTK